MELIIIVAVVIAAGAIIYFSQKSNKDSAKTDTVSTSDEVVAETVPAKSEE
jgi:flagellar basal body-associated protein FliL